MADSNEQSNLLRSLALSVAPEDYLINKNKIAEAKALISVYEEMNEAGKQSHDEFARELEQKIREGEQARALLEQLKSQSTLQASPSLPIQRPAIDYPSSSSRIEEVPSYDQATGHSHQYHTSNQQTHKFVPQATAQPIGTSSYQLGQWTSSNAVDGGQPQQTSHQLSSPNSQQNIMQNNSSRVASYTPFGFSPAVQGRVHSHKEPTHYDVRVSNQGQQRTATSAPQGQVYSSLQTIPTQAPGPSSHAAYTTRPPQFVQQASSTQNNYSQAAASRHQAMVGGSANPQWPPHKATNIATATASSSGDRDSSSNPAMFDRPINSLPVVTGTSPKPISTNPQTMPEGYGTSSLNQTTTRDPPLRLVVPATLPSLDLAPIQYIREFREAIKRWEVQDPMGVMRIIIRGGRQSVTWNGDVDHFCDHWLRRQGGAATSGFRESSNATTVPANSQSDPSSKQTQLAMSMNMRGQAVTSSNTQKALPSTVHRVGPSIVQQSQSVTHQIATLSTSRRPTSSTSQIQLSAPSTSGAQRPPSTSRVRPPPSMTQYPSFASVPETPSRPLSTMMNGVPRSVKQADKKFLASHILFGLGKRPREPDTGPTALTAPHPKRRAQHLAGQTGIGISLSASSTIGQAIPVQNPIVPPQIAPIGTSPVSSLWRDPNDINLISPVIPQQPQQISKSSTSTSVSSDQQQLDNIVTSEVATATSTEISEVSKTSDQMSLNLEDGSIVQAGGQEMEVPLSVVQPDLQEKNISDDHAVTSFGSSVLQHCAAATVLIVTPPATSQTATLLPVPVPLSAPVAISSLRSSEVNENSAQAVASSTLEQRPQADALAKPQRPFTDVTSPVPSKAPTNAQMPQADQPLFLPSPVSSPGINAYDDICASRAQSGNVASNPSFDELDLRKSSSFVKRKNRAYVLAPPRPKYLVKYLQLGRKKIRASLKKVRMTSRSSVSTSIAGEEDLYNESESHSPGYPYEQRAVQLACSRLQELTCKWDGCSIKMNSVDALISHLNRQHKPSHSNKQSFLCRWTQCGRRCHLQERHLEKHAFVRLNCPYEDCDETFRSAPPLWKHIKGDHEDDRLKPSALPSLPKLEPPGAIPGVIPSYMITTRRVDPFKISSARHALVGPRILRIIAGLERERLSRQKSRKTIRSSNGDIIPEEDVGDDYEFLNARPTRYSSHLSQPVDMKLEDLNSENISKLVDEGLTLWGGEEPEGDDDWDIETPIGQRSGDPASPTVGDREHRNDQDEVEKMLTEMVVA